MFLSELSVKPLSHTEFWNFSLALSEKETCDIRWLQVEDFVHQLPSFEMSTNNNCVWLSSSASSLAVPSNMNGINKNVCLMFAFPNFGSSWTKKFVLWRELYAVECNKFENQTHQLARFSLLTRARRVRSQKFWIWWNLFRSKIQL